MPYPTDMPLLIEPYEAGGQPVHFVRPFHWYLLILFRLWRLVCISVEKLLICSVSCHMP